MAAKILFSPITFDSYSANQTLPSRFERMLDKMELEKVVKGKLTAIKMHVGREIGFTTIHPLFVKILVDKLKAAGAKVYITDQAVEGSRRRGYTEEFLGVPILDAEGFLGKYKYEKLVDHKTFKNVDIAGYINDAEVMINLSHVKGHGVCGYGGACKNIAMGCVSDRTRHQIHGLEGGLEWDESKCEHCNLCIESCNHKACSFKAEKFSVFYHNCTVCQHCVKTCPTQAITLNAANYEEFQKGMALCTEEVLKTFEPGNVLYINFLTNLTALCDCWGLSLPAFAPDIGIMASDDIVAIEKACVDAIKVENLLPNGVPQGVELGTKGHLLERIHGKNPYVQIDELEKRGLGTQEYEIEEVL
jgi:uncharacterized protein